MKYNELLKSKGLKITKARVAILDMLSCSKLSLSADEIYEKCKLIGLNINLSTVYRCLESFEDKKIVDKFSNVDGICSYKLKGEEHKHLIRCNVCHKEVEIPCPMRQYEEIVEKETGFTLTEHNLVMNGVCKECRNKKK